MEVGDSGNGQSFGMTFSRFDVVHSADSFFDICMSQAVQGAIICCGTERAEQGGILRQHGYSMIRAIKNVAASGLDMIQLRNAHGEGEWNGKWSDKSDAWGAYPAVYTALVLPRCV